MRVLICSKRDLTSVLTLNTLLEGMAGHDIRILLANRTRQREETVDELRTMKFFERDLPFETLFPWLDRQIAAAAAPRGRLATLEGLQQRYGIPIAITKSLKDPATLDFIETFQPDLILSVRFSFIFNRTILQLPRLGVLNIHGAPLPRHAGLYGHLRALLDRPERLSCALHIVDEGIDTGPIVARADLPVTPSWSLYRYAVELHRLGAQLFLETLAGLEQGAALAGVAQDPTCRSYGSYPTAEQFRRFRALGFRLIDIEGYGDLVSGFNPALKPMALAAADRFTRGDQRQLAH